MPARLAFMPLVTYPEVIADRSILAAAGFAASLGFELQVSAYSVTIPRVSSPMGGLILNVPGLFRAAEEKSKADCQRLKDLFDGSKEIRVIVQFSSEQVPVGSAHDIAAAEARYYDLAVLPWSDGTVLAQDMAEAVIFGSGRPAILVPPSAPPTNLDHIAIAWDASRVAARALGDALLLLPKGGRVSVLTVKDEKLLPGSTPAESLATSLERRGFQAKACSITIGTGGRTIAEALQEAALIEGAQLLAMGGFGHSRLRDFVLGGATKGVLADLRLPTLLSH
jgi:nucleotide-binding universal stress UspA family protein